MKASHDELLHESITCLEDVYLELNAFPDRESNLGPFDLEPTVLTAIPPCFGTRFACRGIIIFNKNAVYLCFVRENINEQAKLDNTHFSKEKIRKIQAITICPSLKSR